MKFASSHLVGGLHEVRVFANTSPGAEFRTVESEPEEEFWPVTDLLLRVVQGGATHFDFIVSSIYAAELIWASVIPALRASMMRCRSRAAVTGFPNSTPLASWNWFCSRWRGSAAPPYRRCRAITIAI